MAARTIALVFLGVCFTGEAAAQEDSAPILAVASADDVDKGEELTRAVRAHLAGLDLRVMSISAHTHDSALASARGVEAIGLLWAGPGLDDVRLVRLRGDRFSKRLTVPDQDSGWTSRCEVVASKVLALAPTLLSMPPDWEEPEPQPAGVAHGKKQHHPSKPPPVEESTPQPPVAIPVEKEPLETAVTPGPGWVLSVAPRVGAIFPLSRLEPFVIAGLEAEVAIPPLGFLSVALDLNFTRPQHRGSVTDNLSQTHHFVHKVYQTRVALEVLARLPGRHTPFAFLAGAGPVLNHLLSVQSSDLDSHEAREKSVEAGVVGLVAGEARLGQGYLFVEARYFYSDLDHDLTGDASTSSIAASFGYRIVF